jgi:hypothetical protein
MPIPTDPEFLAAVERTDARFCAEFALGFMACAAVLRNRPYVASAGSASVMRGVIHRAGLKVPSFGDAR